MLFDQQLASGVLDALDTAKEAATELNNALLSKSNAAVETISSDLRTLLRTLQTVGHEQHKKNPEIKLGQQMECALDSLERVVSLAKTAFDLSRRKLEFELFPMLQDIYAQFYFWACVYPDAEKTRNYNENEVPRLYGNAYIAEAVKSGRYKYEVSIVVIGYNKLDYTKMCCESLLANIPTGLSYELILLNHGSSDGTKEYFAGLNPHKQIDVKINNCGCQDVHARVIEGKYQLAITNDTIITANAISNMLRAVKEDPGIAQLVPTTPNISNLQTIPASYGDFEEMKAFAKNNNCYDPYRHEARTRLCNPISLLPAEFIFHPEVLPMGRICMMGTEVSFSFPDDLLGMQVRRLGLKNVLAKDAYCYHFGSVTIKDEAKKAQLDMNETYRKGRVIFEKIYGIDPWGTGFCYAPALAPAIKCEFEGHIEVLGVNCGHGSNSLKVKELYKEMNHNLDVSLTNVTGDTRCIDDLRGVSDSARIVKTIDEIFADGKQYHHIVVDDPFYGSGHNLDDLKQMFKRLVAGGTLFVNYGAEREPIFKYRFPKVEFAGNWAVLKAEN
jgi:GT2 family glycosyltransferase